MQQGYAADDVYYGKQGESHGKELVPVEALLHGTKLR
jgi:hypothetical protein